MADEPQPQSQADTDKINFIGMDEVPSLFADSFIVATTGEMAQLYFFQNSPPPTTMADLGTTRTRNVTQAKCFARIVITPSGLSKLLEAIANNLGLVVSKRQEEPQQ